jgi:hypothetical protein
LECQRRIKRGYRSLKDAKGTDIYEQKRQADAELNRLRTNLREELKKKNRRRHFRDKDTALFNQQYDENSLPLEQEQSPKLALPIYQIPERAEFVHIIRDSKADLTKEEVHARATTMHSTRVR